MYTRAQMFDVSASTPNRDLQMVELKARVIYRPDPTKIDQIYKNLGPDYVQKVLTSVVNEVIRGVCAQFNAQQLLSQREQVSEKIKRGLVERTQSFNILIDDVSQMDMHFSREYEKAVEEKQIAQQTAERAKFMVDRAIQEKKSTIIKAEADVQAIQLIGAVVKDNPGILLLYKNQNSLFAITTNRISQKYF